MCWFHVTQNVWKYVRQFHVSKEETRESFEELYDLHYAPETEFESVKQRVLSKWEAIPAGSAARKLTQHIIRQWLNTHRFGRWQAYWTPKGYATTNNPLEQYHRLLKIECAFSQANEEGGRISSAKPKAFTQLKQQVVHLADSCARISRNDGVHSLGG
ncbi:hypothetical protein PF003_g16847 [Phytophthora fragariae]|nr:hypothetical protein PF003_g16847 [Phytophthora fragariae]